MATNQTPLAERWTAALRRLGPDGFGEQVGAELHARAWAEVLDVPYIDRLAGQHASAEFIEKIPISFARHHGLLGLAAENGQLQVVVGSLEAWPQLDVVARHLRRAVEPAFAPESEIVSAINTAYQQRAGQAQALIESLDGSDVVTRIEEGDTRQDLLDVSGRSPVIKLVNLILFEAVKGEASDVHLQPYEDRLVVRLRIDGILFDAFNVPKDLQDEVISRIKVVGRMDIAEKRLPQDGRATAQVGDRLIDLRIASLPTSHGERVVIRLLDKSSPIYSLGELGMEPETLVRFSELIGLEHGLILVTGPTGSGKSTTLYAALQRINAKDRNVVTLEDPIEYQLAGISQTQVSDKKGMTFASGLRNVLRQDPDIIMVGEIRDRETAVMSIQSALTGHLVFSTLHTNDAASAITRLLDLGIEPYLVASSVIAVLAQRLVRKVCRQCAIPCADPRAEGKRLGLSEEMVLSSGGLVQGRGCAACRETGYRGRIGVFELLVIDELVRREIQSQVDAMIIRSVAVGQGMRLLRDDCLAKLLSHVTTVDEVVRLTQRSQ